MYLVTLVLVVIFVVLYIVIRAREPFATVVVSKYKEDTGWTQRVKYPCAVYEKENPKNPYNVPVNKGHEASAYFKYIVDHYDRLPKYVFFVHGHESDWHHKESIVDKINDFEPSVSYTNINDPEYSFVVNEEFAIDTHEEDVKSTMKEWWNQNMFPYLGPLRETSDTCCAQFVLSRKQILKNPLKFYKQQYNWLISTELPSSLSARFYEWTWKLIFS